MAKGKKFDAAEKYFRGEIEKRDKLITQLKHSLANERIDNANLRCRINELETANAELNDWVQRLLEYTELSKEELVVACENEKKASRMFKTMEAVLRYI